MSTIALDDMFEAMAKRVQRQQDRLNEAQSRIDDAIEILTESIPNNPGNFRASLVDAGDLIGHVQIEVDLQRQDLLDAHTQILNVLDDITTAYELETSRKVGSSGLRSRISVKHDPVSRIQRQVVDERIKDELRDNLSR